MTFKPDAFNDSVPIGNWFNWCAFYLLMCLSLGTAWPCSDVPFPGLMCLRAPTQYYDLLWVSYGLMVIYYGLNDGFSMVFSKILWEFSVLAYLRMACWEVQQAHGFIPRPLPSSSRCLESWWLYWWWDWWGFIRSKKTRSSLRNPLRFSRDETLFGYKTKMLLESRILFWKTNMFENGWRLAITDFVRTGVFLWDWVDSSFCWISLMI